MVEQTDGPDLTDARIKFLYKAIEDAQAIIRFTDGKAGAVVGVWVALATTCIKQELWTRVSAARSELEQLCVVALLSCGFLCMAKSLWLAFLTLVPRSSPAAHIVPDPENGPLGLFYLHTVKPKLAGRYLFFESPEPKLSPPVKEYLSAVNEIDPQHIMRELVYELQKVSYIRNVKIARAGESVRALLHFTVVALLLLLFKAASYCSLVNWYAPRFDKLVDPALFVVLFVGHHIADYLMQTDRQAHEKSSKLWPLLCHSVVYTVTVLALAYLVTGFFSWVAAISLLVTHAAIDSRHPIYFWCKVVKGIRNPSHETYSGVVRRVDQVFHIVVLFTLSLRWY
ncbi:MAG: DUF3307 domain-containing protein [Firmicutes bacterium]|nr:DUF3307 domain-containing protein [Bacillota bacterium]